MYKKDCRACLFGDKCRSDADCEYFSILDDYDDDTQEEYIDAMRGEYYMAWMKYVSDNGDDSFLF
nr:MAG TPA: toxin [Caudoviricetes sp.]